MNISDPISDMLTRIRNASSVKHKSVNVPHSKIKTDIAKILKKEGFISDYITEGSEGKRVLKIFLKYDSELRPVIKTIKRISKQGSRRYASANKMPKVLSGLGMAILTTSKGVMTDRDAYEKGVGGEILCEVW